jgi:predicted nucleic acid-binding protein
VAELDPLDLTRQDWARVAQLCDRYRDLRLDPIDASLVAIAERLGVGTIATLNHRDFTVVRPSHVDAFELLP